MGGRGIIAAVQGLAFVALSCLGTPASALDPGSQPVVVTPLASTDRTAAGQPIVPPQEDVRVIASHFEIAPGAKLAVHKHPYPRYAYVVQGTLQVTDVETGNVTTYNAGDFIVELIDRWHFGANAGSDPVKLIVIDQVEGHAAHTILQQQ